MFDLPFPQDFEESHLDLAERLKRKAWRISNLVFHSDLPWIDIEVEINQMRQLVEDEQPENTDLFEHTFAARFYRLREQWRNEEDFRPAWMA